MIVNIRQGLIISSNSVNYLTVNSEGNIALNINTPIHVTFAHGVGDYLIEESVTINNRWVGPFNDDESYWFYWDISQRTGKVSYSNTQVLPTFGLTFPPSPTLDEHFFNTSDNFQYYWDGVNWVKTIRVFAGSLINNILSLLVGGSQVNINGSFDTNFIRFHKARNPIRKEFSDGNFVFVVNSDDATQDGGQLENFKVERLDNSVTAAEFIPQHTAVVLNDDGEYIKASTRNIRKEVIGIAEQDMQIGDKKNIVVRGYIEDKVNFEFTEKPLTPLYIDNSGNITPTTPIYSSMQRVGYIVSTRMIYIDINEQILIIGVTPPALSVTPTVTPTMTMTPTMTVTPSPTMQPTPSITVTATVTPSVTASMPPTPTGTPVSTVTPTPTVTPSSTS